MTNLGVDVVRFGGKTELRRRRRRRIISSRSSSGRILQLPGGT